MCLRLLTCLALCLMTTLSGWALAATDGDIRCWTSNSDEYYHVDKTCAGEEMFPIPERSALAFGKKACPECVEAEDPAVIHEAADIWISERGGTYVLCIPAQSMENVSDLPETDEPETMAFTGEEAEKQLRDMMPESSYKDIQARIKADGWAYDSCRLPELVSEENVLYMSARRIEDDWYFVIRPETAYGDNAEIRWRIAEWDIQLESYGTLTLTCGHVQECVNVLTVEDHSDAKTVFKKSYGDLEITVYRQQGMNTAVLRDGGHRKAAAAMLVIAGTETETALEGYTNNRKQATYCCIISDAELAGLVAGMQPELKFTQA